MSDNATAVLEVLTAKDSPRTIRELAYITGLTRREVEDAIQHLRATSRSPICSDGRGVWIARDREELRDMIARLDGRCATQHATARGLRRLLERLDGQTTWEVAS